MAEIKVGQKYMLVNGSVQAGHVAEITSVTEDYVYYRPGLYFPDGDWKNLSFLSNWELLEEEDSEPLAVSEVNQLSLNEDKVNHPSHYGGDTTYEVIKVAEAWGFDNDAYLFNVLKYIARAEHKGSERQDLEKAKFYLERRISNL